VETAAASQAEIEKKAAAGESSTQSNSESAAARNVEDKFPTRINFRAMHIEHFLERRQLPKHATGSEQLAGEEVEFNLLPCKRTTEELGPSPVEKRLPASQSPNSGRPSKVTIR
jgi:hypothetical protein